MSGLEVAGLVLGALPILLHAADELKTGTEAAFRSRIYINKLSLALLLQQSILTELLRSLLAESGYDDVWRLDHDPVCCFDDPNARKHIVAYLGPEKSLAFLGLLDQAHLAVKDIARNISGFLPGSVTTTENLLMIIEVNQHAKWKSTGLLKRFKLLFRARDLKNAISEIDQATDALQRFARLVSLNKSPTQEASSWRAKRLAEGLRQVRGFANNLHLAMSRGWRQDCHDQHGANLHLDDRVETALEMFRRYPKEECIPSLVFHFVLTVSDDQRPTSFYEARFRVLRRKNGEEGELRCPHSDPTQCQETLILPQESEIRQVVEEVENICSTIEQLKRGDSHRVLVLAEYQQLGTIAMAHEEEVLSPCFYGSKIPLRELLSKGPRIPLKFRSFLALRVASSLLQLLQTPWLDIGNETFEDAVLFLVKGKKARPLLSSCLDFDRPVVTTCFKTSKKGKSVEVDPKTALLELGISLLELWHERLLEEEFTCEFQKDYFIRRDLALRWLDDMTNPLPPLYDKATSHCIRGMIGGESRFEDWENKSFWNAFCVDIIEPLSKNCRQWMRKSSG